jgi:hypothetical protein
VSFISCAVTRMDAGFRQKFIKICPQICPQSQKARGQVEALQVQILAGGVFFVTVTQKQQSRALGALTLGTSVPGVAWSPRQWSTAWQWITPGGHRAGCPCRIRSGQVRRSRSCTWCAHAGGIGAGLAMRPGVAWSPCQRSTALQWIRSSGRRAGHRCRIMPGGRGLALGALTLGASVPGWPCGRAWPGHRASGQRLCSGSGCAFNVGSNLFS